MSRARLTLSAWAVGASLAASGCAQNALFELYVELPPPIMVEGGGMARFARVIALPVIADRDTTFDGSRSRVVALETSRQFLGVTLVRGAGFVERELTVRVIYCETEEDCDPVQPERWAGSEDLVFETAFYVGDTTCYAHSLPDDDLSDGLALPTTQRRVSTCQVGGCTDDDFTESTADFCRLGTTQHFCTAGQAGNVCDRLNADMLPMLAP